MNSKKRTKVNIIKILLFAVFIVGAIVIAVYPFDNRNLSIHFVTEENEYVIERNNEEIGTGNCSSIVLEDTDCVKIKKVRIYGESKTTILREIPFGELVSYIVGVEQGELQWEEDGIVVTGNGSICLSMNEEFVKILQEQSKTFLQERLILIALYGCMICLAVLIVEIIRERKKEENWNNHGPIFETKKFFADIKKYGQYMVYAAKTDLKAEVADSYLNRLWWLLEPLFNMIVYVIVFGNMMGNSVENYATFVFSAFLMWNYFSKSVNYSVKAVRYSKDIITKVYIPKFVLLLSNMILNMMKLLFSMIVLVIMLVVFRVHIGINIIWVIPAFIVMILLSFGVGMIFLHFGVYIDDLSYAVGILLNMLMFMSGIFYEVMTTLPEPLNNIVMILNPVAIFTDTMRNALLYNQASNLPALGMWFIIAVILCCVGVHTVYKNENSYVKIV